MHIEEPVTHQGETQLSLQSTQATAKEGLLQATPAFVEVCQHSHAGLQMAIATSGMGIWEWNLVTDKTYYDFQWKQILGYEVEEIENHHQSFERLVHPEDLPRVMGVLNDYLKGRTSVYEVEFRMLAKSGEWKWILDRGKVFEWNESGNPIRMAGILQEITKQKRQEEALQRLKKQEQLFNVVRKSIHSHVQLEPALQTTVDEVRQFLQVDRVVIYRYHDNGNYTMAFESLRKPDRISSSIQKTKASLVFPIYVKLEKAENQYSAQEARQKQVWGLLIVYDCSHCRQWQEWEIKSLQQLTIEISIALKQHQLSTELQQEITSRLFVEAQHRKTIQQLENIQKELKNTQQQLFQNEKMANLGQLLTDLANEIYNPANFINASLQPTTQYAEELIRLVELYQYYYSPPEELIATQIQRLDLNFIKTDFLKLLWSMRAGSERIKDIVFALWNFARVEEHQIAKADLHEGLDCVLKILQNRLKEQPDRPRIQVIKEYGELPLVECYPSELNHVFMNILINAIDALEERVQQDDSFVPKIWIQTEVVNCHLSLVGSHDKQPWKHHKVIVRISDNGKGILPHIKQHIFEPFFTTKTPEKGKGLGLSISQQIIVEKHQGKLRCHSQLGQGTEFEIELSTRTTHYSDIAKHTNF
jgi:two-component system, NtrC family, sensor kinase